MPDLSPTECRVLGVLIEKAHTTPAQYPLTMNALVTGANQRNNRAPVTSLTEEQVFDAVDRLKTRGLVREVFLSGSRVPKFRHVTREVLGVETPELVVLAELMLRGPQTLGELRGNAARMHPVESLEACAAALERLRARSEPLVAELPPEPGSRAARYAHLLAGPVAAAERAPRPAPAATGTGPAPTRAPAPAPGRGLEDRVADLEAHVAELRAALESLRGPEGGPGRPGTA